MEGGREQNYWPGFVDALSNVVLTLVFVLVIFVFALVMASNKVEQKMKEISQAQDAHSTGQASHEEEKADLKRQLEVMTAELEKLRSESAAQKQSAGATSQQQGLTEQNQEKQIIVDDKTDDKKNQGTVQIDPSSSGVIIGFPLSVTEMDEKSAERLGHVLDAVKEKIGKHKIILKSYIGKETFSAAQRLAYYRAIGTRNYLITKLGELPSEITLSIVRPPQPEEGRVEIIFQKE
jgi:hypothetical protein